jgi:2-dehydropantoate 2-reductase
LRSDFSSVSRDGWTFKSIHGDFALPPDNLNLYQDPRHMPPADLVLVTLKTTANQHFDELIRPIVHDRSILLTMQNGLGNEQQLADLFGPDNVLGAMAFVCINRLPGGVIHHMSHGLIRIGEFATTSVTPRLLHLEQMFKQSLVHCEAIADLDKGRWEKLVWNIPFNGLGALLDLDTRALLATAEGRGLVIDLMEEVVTTASAAGHELSAGIIQMNIERTLAMGPYRSSMQIDHKAGRQLEIESIIGRPLRSAEALGVKANHLRTLYHMLKARIAGDPLS